MNAPRPLRPLRAVVVGAAVLVALAVPTVAHADTTGSPTIQPAISRNATIHVDSVSLTAKVLANVNVSVTCQPLMTFDWDTGQTVPTTVGHLEGGQVTLIQAQGRTVAWAGADLFGGTATCDGSTINHASVAIAASSSPWKTGTAVVGASVDVIDENMTTSDFASSGPVTVRLTSH